MRFSIITAAYNAKSTIGATLASVRAQRDVVVEHIVVDGASSDGTSEFLRSKSETIDVLISEHDHGLYDALNKGIRAASGEVIGILHADDFYPDESVLLDVAAAFAQDSAEVVLGDVLFVDRDKPTRGVRWSKARSWSPDRFAAGWMPPHPGFFVRRVHHECLGLYRTDYRIAADFELLVRFLHRARLPYVFLDRTVVHMRRGGLSTRSPVSNWVLNREIVRACGEHGLHTSLPRLMLKYPEKLLELVRPRSSNDPSRS